MVGVEKDTKKKDRYIMSSVNSALKVLDLLSIRDHIGVAEISRITGIDKTSVFKILYTLEHRDYVIKTADAHYKLGIKLSNYGDRASERQSIVDVATPIMRRLRDDCHESVYLGILNTNGRVILMHREDGDSPNRIVTRIGYEMACYTNALGKLLLANLDAAMQKSIVDGLQFRPLMPKTVPSTKILYGQLTELRGKEWAEEYEENYPGHSDLAAPIYDGADRCIAALSIVCVSTVLRENKEAFLPVLLRASRDISRKMGYYAGT
jgi:DNA-binding IclR family transcriptional regulator